MPDANALTRADLVTAILGRRFPAATQTTNARRWLATAYADVWHAADWTFKRVSRATLAVTAGDETPTMPAAFADAIKLYDDLGNEIPRLSQEVFEQRYASSIVAGERSTPDAFAVVDRQIILGPRPVSSANFLLSYRRRLASRTATLAVQAGIMALDTDFPLWDDHHSILIPRAQSIGLVELSDPTWQLAQQQYQLELERMIEDYTTPIVGQWGDAWAS